MLCLIAAPVCAESLYVSVDNYPTEAVDRVSSNGTVGLFATLPSDAEYFGEAFDGNGNLYVVGSLGPIQKITPSGTVSLYATIPTSFNTFPFLLDMAFDGNGNLYAADNAANGGNGQIYKITSAAVSIFATVPGGAAGLAFDGSGNLYATGGNEIYKITSAGVVSNFATLPSIPLDLAFDGTGNLFASTEGNISQISKITPAGIVSLFASLPADSNSAAGLAFDAGGNLLVAEEIGTISEIAPNGTVSTFASGIPDATYLAFGPDPVPEPSSFALAGLGILGLIGCVLRRRRQHQYVPILAALLCVAAVSPALAITYTTFDYSGPGALGGDEFGVAGGFRGISDGNVVGNDYTGSPGTPSYQSFIYNGSSYTTLPEPPGISNISALGISGGNIVGQYNDASGTAHGFLYNGSSYTTLDDPKAIPGGETQAWGVSGSTVVGFYFGSDGYHGFLYSSSTYTTLDDPSAPGHDTYSFGISGSNIVGTYVDSSGVIHGFLYNGTNWTTLDDPSAVPNGQTIAQGISGGNIVGTSFDSSSGITHGFLYDGSTYTTLDGPLGTWASSYATGIDGDTIIGGYFDASGEHGFIATVPEPSTFVLAALGFGALVWIARRRSFSDPDRNVSVTCAFL
jgi:hypothetical protein